MKTLQYHNFAVRLHSNDRATVQQLVVNSNHYAYILHNKDRYNDDTEDHTKGDLKKPHYHMVLNFSQKISVNQVRTLIRKYIPHANEMVSPLQNAKSGFDYLTHSTEQSIKDNKYRYDPGEIISDKPEFWHENEVQEQIRQDKEDWTVVLTDELVLHAGCLRRDRWLELAHKYGRDFILNSRRVKEFVDYVLEETL